MIKRTVFFIIWFLTLIQFVQGQDVERTLNVGAYGIQLGFSQDRTKIRNSEMASNVLFVINNTGKTMDLSLQINPPAGWKMYGKEERTIKIGAKDTLYFPLRIKPSYGITGNTSYIVNVFLSTKDYTIASAIWNIEVESISSWNAYLSDNKVYITEEIDSVSLNLNISNQGNSTELLQVRLKPDFEVLVYDSRGIPVNNIPISLLLQGNSDTTFVFLVKKNALANRPKDINSKGHEQNRYRVKVSVLDERQGKGSRRSWTGNIDIFEVHNTRKIEETRYNSLPLNVEINTYDAISEQTFTSLSLYGSKVFKNNSTLDYYLQSNFVQNQLKTETYLGDYQYISYNHKYFSISMGDISAGVSGGRLSGKGAKASIKLANNVLGGLYVRRPQLFSNYFSEGFGFFHSLKLKRVSWSSYYQHDVNYRNRIITDYGLSNAFFRLGKHHAVKIGGGYSVEKHNWDSAAPLNVNGYGVNLGYRVSYSKISFGINANYSTPYYSVSRGMKSIYPLLNFRINKKANLSVAYSYLESEPSMIYQGKYVNNHLYNRQESASLTFAFVKGKDNYSIQPNYRIITSKSIDVKTAGVNFDYRTRLSTQMLFYSNVFAGYSYFPRSPEIGEIFVTFIKASIRYKKFSTMARYYYGPYYITEQLEYINTEENPQKFYLSSFYDYWFMNNKMKLSTNLNYFYTIIHKRHQLNIRPEIYYYAKSGFRFSFYARYIFIGEGEYYRTYAGINGSMERLIPSSTNSRFEIGAGVKFRINVPMGLSKNYDAKVIAFKDINGNGIKDINETGISQLLIHLQLNDTITNNIDNNVFKGPEQYDLVTNKEGLVEYKNIPLGDYVVTATPLTSMGGWYDGKTFYRTIDKNKTIYIPLSKGARISGGILVERDKYGVSKKVELGNIRITAVNQDNGKTFSALTTNNGSFTLYVPNGFYVVTINEGAVSTQFNFKQNDIPVDITADFDSYNVSFYLAENKRNINIRGKRSRRLPINRLKGSSGRSRPKKKALPEQKTQLDDPKYLPVVEPTEQGTVWLIQLFPNEKARMLITAFDTLQGTANVRCITGQSDGFLYITESFPKKKSAKKLLKSVKKKGYGEAEIVSMVFGNKVVEADTVSKEEDNSVHKTIKTVDSDEDRAYYRVEIKVSPTKLKSDDFMTIIPDLDLVYEIEQDGLFKYAVGQFDTSDEAKAYKMEIIQKYGLTEAFVTQYKTAW